jgi:hypothetical protein
MSSHGREAADTPIPLWIRLFCFALMGPAMSINAVLVALALPFMAPYGTDGLVLAGIAGFFTGILPARWLARRIHQGIAE